VHAHVHFTGIIKERTASAHFLVWSNFITLTRGPIYNYLSQTWVRNHIRTEKMCFLSSTMAAAPSSLYIWLCCLAHASLLSSPYLPRHGGLHSTRTAGTRASGRSVYRSPSYCLSLSPAPASFPTSCHSRIRNRPPLIGILVLANLESN
jgi:hypothetical protein